MGVDKNMAINGSELVNHPWNTTFSPYTDLFQNLAGEGTFFYLIPFTFVTIALFVKTRDPALTSAWMLGSGTLLAGGSIFTGAINMGMAFTVFAAIGIAGLFISIFYKT